MTHEKLSVTCPSVLSIAGSDCSGGAGIQADQKTFASFHCYGMTVLTAITAQNTTGVFFIEPVSIEMIKSQLRAVLDDIPPAAIKIGMMFSETTVQAIAEELQQYMGPIVLDPVIVATSGDNLTDCRCHADWFTPLLDKVVLITPNREEAEVLLNRTILRTKLDLEDAAVECLYKGWPAVLLTGGDCHRDMAEDILAYRQSDGSHRLMWFSYPRILTHHTHGTGCTLSSAITARLAYGDDLQVAIQRAKYFVAQALKAAQKERRGQGCGPLNHFALEAIPYQMFHQLDAMTEEVLSVKIRKSSMRADPGHDGGFCK